MPRNRETEREADAQAPAEAEAVRYRDAHGDAKHQAGADPDDAGAVGEQPAARGEVSHARVSRGPATEGPGVSGEGPAPGDVAEGDVVVHGNLDESLPGGQQAGRDASAELPPAEPERERE